VKFYAHASVLILSFQATVSLGSIRAQIEAQKKEVELTQSRLESIEQNLKELEQKKTEIMSRVNFERSRTQQFARHLFRNAYQQKTALEPASTIAIRAQERLLSYRLKEIEALRIDLEDATAIERSIQENRGQIRVALEELEQSRWVLAANKKFDTEEIALRLSKVQKLRSENGQISVLIQQFSARNELSEMSKSENSAFGTKEDFFKGTLLWPVSGPVTSSFGDKRKGQEGLGDLRVARGMEIAVDQDQSVQAPAHGVVSYVGEVPSLGRVVILNHGRDFYSILGSITVTKVERGQSVKMGETVGSVTAATGKIYFEWRSRNIPVDPAEWLTSKGQTL